MDRGDLHCSPCMLASSLSEAGDVVLAGINPALQSNLDNTDDMRWLE